MFNIAEPVSKLKLFVHKYTMPLLQKYPLQAALSMLKSLYIVTKSENLLRRFGYDSVHVVQSEFPFKY